MPPDGLELALTGLPVPSGGPELVVVGGGDQLPDYAIDQLRDLLRQRQQAGTGAIEVVFAGPLTAAQLAWARRRVTKSPVQVLYPTGPVTPGPGGLQSAGGWQRISRNPAPDAFGAAATTDTAVGLVYPSLPAGPVATTSDPQPFGSPVTTLETGTGTAPAAPDAGEVPTAQAAAAGGQAVAMRALAGELFTNEDPVSATSVLAAIRYRDLAQDFEDRLADYLTGDSPIARRVAEQIRRMVEATWVYTPFHERRRLGAKRPAVTGSVGMDPAALGQPARAHDLGVQRL